MAATSVSCGAVMLFRLDINRVLRVTTLAATRKCSQNETWCRRWRSISRRGLTTTTTTPTFPSSLEPSPAKKESKEIKTLSENSELTDVSVIYHRGLPRVTVPLPSRREKCMFTLKPITHTVGDFLDMLKQEDKGIDRASITTIDGIRIASGSSIESLMEEDFKLIVNDNSYTVSAPQHERLTTEEAQQLADVRVLVGQLYEALHVDEHQLQEERQILSQLEDIRFQLQPLEEKITELDATASRRTNLLTWVGLGLMSVQFGILARLTWWEYSWDIMEPVTYFVTYGTAIACYAYYVLTKQEYLLPDVRDRQHLLILHKKARKLGLDLVQYNTLKEQSSDLETKLQRLRDPAKVRKTLVERKREEREKYSSSSSRSPSSSPSPSPERDHIKSKAFEAGLGTEMARLSSMATREITEPTEALLSDTPVSLYHRVDHEQDQLVDSSTASKKRVLKYELSKMGRTVYAEDSVLTYLKSLVRPDGYTIGLILGQSTAAQKDFVVHLARTPPPAAKDVIEESFISSTSKTHPETEPKYIKSINDIQESWVADHAKHVTRMLPGGMWVLGIFIIGPGDMLNDANSINRLRSVLVAIRKHLSMNKYLYGNNDQENLILQFNGITQKVSCKSLDASLGGILKPAEWKFQAKATKWHQLEARVDFDRLFPILADDIPTSLKKQLQGILSSISETIDSALIIVEGESRASEDAIEIIGKKKKDRKEIKSNNDGNNADKTLQVSIYIPCPKNPSSDIMITSCSATMRLVGQVVSRTFVHQKATIEEATAAVKQDIMRSLASRLEMHWDSLIEEENGSPEENVTLHEPPRRVLVSLPQSRVTLSDYLFPGEGPQEALVSLQELLDLEVQESSVQKELELQADPSEFYYQNTADTAALDGCEDSSRDRHLTIYVAGLGVAILLLIAQIIVTLY